MELALYLAARVKEFGRYVPIRASRCDTRRVNSITLPVRTTNSNWRSFIIPVCDPDLRLNL